MSLLRNNTANSQNQASGNASRLNRPNNANTNNQSTNNPFAQKTKVNSNRSTPSRFSGTPNRFGTGDVSWIIVPIDETFVRFDLNGLGDPFHRILGSALKLDYADVHTLIHTLETGGKLVDTLTEQMEKAWQSYGVKGASLVYEWRDEIKQIIATQTMIQVNTTEPADDQDNTDNDTSITPVDEQNEPACLRAIDLLLVLNVLARTRADMLLQESPLTLERGFLQRSLVSNDPALVAIARATGCVEEHFTR